jgi:hypothetical protein
MQGIKNVSNFIDIIKSLVIDGNGLKGIEGEHIEKRVSVENLVKIE